MLKWKFIKFLMEILKRQVNSSSNLASFFIVTTHNTPINFNFIRSLLWRKWSHQCSNFETFKYSGENVPYSSCHFPNHKSVFLQILHHCSVPWKITLYSLGHTLHTFHKKNESKWEFLRIFSAQVKLYQIFVMFETANQFFLIFCITLQCYEV